MSSFRCKRCLRYQGDPEDELDAPEDLLCEPCQRARAAPIKDLDVAGVFGPSGPLAAANPKYEARAGQVELAHQIFAALKDGRHILAEGPCGIGKSKAYGVPAAWLASQGKRVMIVTASIALQEQLVKKDLPDLRRELPWAFDFALMKGKSNYLCHQEAEGADDGGLMGPEVDEFATIAKWGETTTTGDKSELLIKPHDLVWGRFSTTSDACTGKKCPSWGECFARAARDAAANAGIVVTNYHLFFLNMAYGGRILPAADVVILDEAHEVPDIARALLGFRVTGGSFRRIANEAGKRGMHEIARELREASDELFSTLLRFSKSDHYKAFLRWPAPIDPSRLEAAVADFARACPRSHLVEYALNAIANVREGLEAKEPELVYSIETSVAKKAGAAPQERAALQARFVSVAGALRKGLWDANASVVAVSATMATDGDFTFFREETGAPPEARELVVPTPFDFATQAMLVLPDAKTLPEPNDPRFVEVAAAEVIKVVEACGGRTLALFTSYRALDAVYDRVVRHFRGRWQILRQGDAPPGLLARKFKEDARSVLLGTSSFWTGIDIPGEALTGLVIDRLPFGMPDDPVTLRMTEKDPRGVFARFTVPRSILTFRQGVGRLIRSTADVGTVVCLDKRLSTKSYGTRFLRSLPPMARASSTDAIAPFLRARGVAA